MAEMDSVKLLEEIEIYIDNCKTAGVLSSGSMIKVNREELLAMLEEVHDLLPKEIAESKRIVRNQDKIIADARSKAQRIMQNAAKEAGGIRKLYLWQICVLMIFYQKHRKRLVD